MPIEELCSLILNNGLSVVLVGYFIYKDYKFNEQTLGVLGEIKEVLSSLNTWHEAETRIQNHSDR